MKQKVWKDGVIYSALHHVGDDPLKSIIEDSLKEEFKREPEILDRIADVFRTAVNDYEGDEIC